MISLRPGEKIYLIKRRHRLVLIRELFPEVLIFLATIILMIILFFIPLPSWPDWLIRFIPFLLEFEIGYLLLFFLSLFLLVLWTIIFLVITDYYLTCWIVTNQRTIHAELKGLFNLTYSSVFHDKIQDITVSIKGFLPAIFRFGNIQIQTAGEFREFIFRQVSDPEIVKQAILEAQRDYLRQMKKDGLL